MPMHPGLTRAQGDPGIFSILGKIGRGIAGAVGGLVTGGPTGVIGGAVRGFVGPQQLPLPLPLVTRQIPVPGFAGAAQRLIPGGQTGFVECPPGGGCPSGFRPNKSAYFLKDGTFVSPGSRCVRIRRINPANGKAVKRAIRRENSFIRLAVGTGLVKAPRAARVRRAAGKR